MARRLIGAKSSYETMLKYCKLDQKSVKCLSDFKFFHLKKMQLKMSSAKWHSFCLGIRELIACGCLGSFWQWSTINSAMAANRREPNMPRWCGGTPDNKHRLVEWMEALMFNSSNALICSMFHNGQPTRKDPSFSAASDTICAISAIHRYTYHNHHIYYVLYHISNECVWLKWFETYVFSTYDEQCHINDFFWNIRW